MKSSTRRNKILYDLVKSMTKSEKRYFKLYITRNALGENSVSERLFCAIDKQKEFDEAKLEEQFKGEAFVQNFSVAKNRLYNNILSALQIFHASKSSENKLNTLLNEIEILYDKSLLKACTKRILQAKNIATESNNHYQLLRISEWERKILEKRNFERVDLLSIEGQTEEYLQSVNAIKVHAELLMLRMEVYQNIYGNKQDRYSLEKLLQKLDHFYSNNALEAQTQLMFYQSKSALCFELRNYDESIIFAEKALKLIPTNDIESKVSCLGNIIFLAVQIKQFDKAKTHLFKLKMIQKDLKTNKALEAKLFENIASLELLIKSSEKRFSEAIQIIPPIAEKLSQFNGQISSLKRGSFYLNFAQLQFIDANFKEALKWTNALLNYPKIDSNPHIYSNGILMNMLVHLELGNLSYLKTQLRSSKRYFEKHHLNGPFESSFFRHLSNLCQGRNDYSGWLNEFIELGHNELEYSFCNVFSFEQWLRSKVNGKRMIDIMS